MIPSQIADKLSKFQLNLEKLLNQIKNLKSSFTEVFDNFNARSKSWWSEDIVTIEGSKIEFLTTTYGLHQLMSDPNHILSSSSSCIDLIITGQPNLVINGCVHPSLHPNRHYQTIYSKFNESSC